MDDTGDSSFERRVHLVDSRDLTPSSAAAELVRADGTRQPLSEALLAAVDHLLAAASSDQCVAIDPLDKLQLLPNAAALTSLSERHLRELVAEGRLGVEASPAGEIVRLADVVALDEEFRLTRDQALQSMWDETFSDDPRDA